MAESATTIQLRHVVDLVKEARHIEKNIRSAQRGSATKAIVEQTIDLLERQLAYAEDIQDPEWVACALNLSATFQEALVSGLETLRTTAPPGPEIVLVERPIVDARTKLGRQIKRQVRCAGGKVDLVDMTVSELIECKAVGDAASIAAAGSQLHRYAPHFDPSFGLTIAVPNIQQHAQWLVEFMCDEGFRFIEIDSGELL